VGEAKGGGGLVHIIQLLCLHIFYFHVDNYVRKGNYSSLDFGNLIFSGFFHFIN